MRGHGVARASAAAAGIALLLGSSCAQVVSSTRRERGPLLRTFERQVAREPAGLRAEALARWPSLELRVVSSNACRTEVVREYAEELVTERAVPGAGPSIGTGATLTAVGAALLLLRGSFSAAPDTSYIDAGGRYGPSARQVATGWGVTLLALGVPAIAAGVVGVARSGESVSRATVDAVSDVHESRCEEQPVSGSLQVLGPGGPLVARAVQEGKVLLPLEALRGTVTGLALDGQPVALDAEDAAEVEAFRACGRALPLPDDAALGQESTPALLLRFEEAQRCARVPGAGGSEAVARLAALLESRAVQVQLREPDAAPGPGEPGAP